MRQLSIRIDLQVEVVDQFYYWVALIPHLFIDEVFVLCFDECLHHFTSKFLHHFISLLLFVVKFIFDRLIRIFLLKVSLQRLQIHLIIHWLTEHTGKYDGATHGTAELGHDGQIVILVCS